LRYVIFTTICLFFTNIYARQAITTPILTSAPNFRDLAGISVSNGGTGFVNPTSNNGVMRTGVFYRSSVLSLNDADWATISALNIGRDIDLRTPAEIAKKPDRVPTGATYTNINIFGTPSISSERTIQAIKTAYREFVTNEIERKRLHDVLITLTHDTKANLFHCSAGKDRTGWTAAVLQSIAGVAPATIMNDYLATNNYTAAFVQSKWEAKHRRNPSLDEATVKALLGVQRSYLQTALDQVNSTYGSMDAYLTQGLGLSQANIRALRTKMVNYQASPKQSELTNHGATKKLK